VEAQDIRLGDLSLFDGVQARGPAPVRTVPEGAGERLSRMLAARPGENLRQQCRHTLEFVLGLSRVNGRVAAEEIVGLIPHIPGTHPIVLGESRDDVLDVRLEAAVLLGVIQHCCRWRLYPAGVVDAGNRGMLGPQPRVRVPAGIEQYEDGLDMVSGRNPQKHADPLLEAWRVLLPKQIVEEHPHGVHAEPLRPPELEVDPLGIERGRLPHFELVDGVVGDVVAAKDPRLSGVPGLRLRHRPTLGAGCPR